MMFRFELSYDTVHRRLDSPFLRLDSMMQQGRISDFFTKSDQAGARSRLLKEIGDAITDYQVNLVQTRSLAYSEIFTIGGLTTGHLQESCGRSLLSAQFDYILTTVSGIRYLLVIRTEKYKKC
jgi:hypothetical protein